MTKDPQVIEEWITHVNEHGLNLTKWEEDFMDSITEQFTNWNKISDKQEEILERIYTEKTS